MMEPRVTSSQRDRLLAPRTIWVARSALAKLASASPTSLAAISWYVPSRSASSSRCLTSRSDDRTARPSVGRTCTPMRSPLARARHARGAPDQHVTAGSAGQRDDDPLAGLPAPLDPVVLQVLLQVLLDPVGDPEQGDLAQRGQVARAEVVGERRVDALGGVDVAVRHPPPQRLRRHVDELDLLGLPHDRVGDRLLLLDAGDALDDVVDRLEVLDVQRRDHVDARRRAAPRRPASASRCASRARWCARARRRARPRACGPGSRRRPSPRTSCPGTRSACAGRPRGRGPALPCWAGRASRRARRRRRCPAGAAASPR